MTVGAGEERYEEHEPPASLRPFVRTIWTYASPSPSGAVQRIAPDGCPELILDIGSPYEEQGPDGVFRLQPPVLFAGQMTRPPGPAPRRADRAGRGPVRARRRAGLAGHIGPSGRRSETGHDGSDWPGSRRPPVIRAGRWRSWSPCWRPNGCGAAGPWIPTSGPRSTRPRPNDRLLPAARPNSAPCSAGSATGSGSRRVNSGPSFGSAASLITSTIRKRTPSPGWRPVSSPAISTSRRWRGTSSAILAARPQGGARDQVELARSIASQTYKPSPHSPL
jgi:hypothetical protein